MKPKVVSLYVNFPEEKKGSYDLCLCHSSDHLKCLVEEHKNEKGVTSWDVTFAYDIDLAQSRYY